MEIVIGPSEMQAGDTRKVIFSSSSLGSGIGLAACDPPAHVGGILHFLLPSAVISRSRAQSNPFLFADTGIPAFISAMEELGASKENLKMVLAGGSRIMDQSGPFDLALRNCLAAESLLSENGVAVAHKDLGGSFYRNLRVEGPNIYVEIPGHGENRI